MFVGVRLSVLSSCKKVPRDIFSVFFFGAILRVSFLVLCLGPLHLSERDEAAGDVPMIAVAFVRRFSAKQPHRVSSGIRVGKTLGSRAFAQLQ